MVNVQRQLRYSLPVVLLLGAFVAVLASCNLLNQNTVVEPATIKDCISGFSSAYTGGNYGILYQYFGSGTNANATMRDPTTWKSTQFYSGYAPQPLSGISVTSPTATASFANVNYDSSTNTIITFQMEQDNGYWYIKSLTISNSNIPDIETIT